METKSVWTTPQLITIAHADPAEAILTACKTEGVAAVANIQDGCFTGANCSPCAAIVAS